VTEGEREGWPKGWPSPVLDPTMHPRVMEICDPDTSEVLGGAVFGEDDEYVIVNPATLATLRDFPTCHVASGPPQMPPWRVETPVYAALVDTLGIEPVGVAARQWTDVIANAVWHDTGVSWDRLALSR
jgi:hypothetical protein